MCVNHRFFGFGYTAVARKFGVVMYADELWYQMCRNHDKQFSSGRLAGLRNHFVKYIVYDFVLIVYVWSQHGI